MMQHSARLRRGITQSFWKQKLGEKDEYSQKRLFSQLGWQCPEHVLQSGHWQGERERVQCGQLQPDERSPLRSFYKKSGLGRNFLCL